jgi:Leucine-rich repeat (LRR) protein
MPPAAFEAHRPTWVPAIRREPGTLPAEWRFQPNITLIDLSGNQLEGSLPAGWADLKQLQLLDLSANQLSGGAKGRGGCMR